MGNRQTQVSEGRAGTDTVTSAEPRGGNGTRWTRGTLFLFNLALADASWLLALPFLVQYHLDSVNWTLGRPLCTAVRLLYHSYFYLSIFFVTCVSVERYVAIVHPLRAVALLGRRQACVLCVAIWAATLAFSSPVAQMTELQRCPAANHTNRTICTLYVMLEDPRESLPFSLCWSFAGFLLPLAAIAYCCVRSVLEVRRRRGLCNGRGRHLTRLLSAALVLFALLYLPYHLTRNAAVAVRALYPRNPEAWQPASLAFALEMCVCSLNSCVNPLFSCFVGRRFRREFWGAFARLCRCASKLSSSETLRDGTREAEDRAPAAVCATTAVWAESGEGGGAPAQMRPGEGACSRLPDGALAHSRPGVTHRNC
uniref:G-protein coupled receptors family 1 profile domain-containing protein n=1 Tax=Scleropages formosus TaxID=113540 RepID=A0A8C9T1Q6_SCLFO